MGNWLKKAAGYISPAHYLSYKHLKGNRRYSSQAESWARLGVDPESGSGFDEFGFPTSGQLPDGQIAAQSQLFADRQAARRNARLGRDAYRTLQGGLGHLESFRPGSAVAMTSPFYSNMAQSLLANRMEAPDLMHFGRVDDARRSRKAARRAQYAQLGVQLGGAAMMAMSGGAGAPAAAAITAAGNMGTAVINARGRQSGDVGGASGVSTDGGGTFQEANDFDTPETAPKPGGVLDQQLRLDPGYGGVKQSTAASGGNESGGGGNVAMESGSGGGGSSGGVPGGGGSESGGPGGPAAGPSGPGAPPPETMAVAPEQTFWDGASQSWQSRPPRTAEESAGDLAITYGQDFVSELTREAYHRLFGESTFWEEQLDVLNQIGRESIPIDNEQAMQRSYAV